MESRQYLYQYTSIESLESILKNQTIRLKSLETMDDDDEQKNKDLENFGQFCYISSWTEDTNEDPNMWEKYAGKDGVRIALWKNPFEVYPILLKKLSGFIIVPPIIHTPGDKYGLSVIPLKDILNDSYTIQPTWYENITHKVEYTDDKSRIHPHIVNYEEKSIQFLFDSYGRYKNLSWSYQKEWRYILFAIPVSLNNSRSNVSNNFKNVLDRILKGTEKQPFSFYDLKIDDKAFKNMKITMRSDISQKKQLEIEELVKRYNPSIEILPGVCNL